MTNATEPERLQQLLAQCALGNQTAFAQLYESVSGKLNGIAYRILHSVDSANEVLQEAFVQIWHKAGEYRSDKAEPMTWMASIVRYRAYDRIRFEQRRIEGAQVQAELDNFESIADSSHDQPLMCEFGQQLEDCLATLDSSQQGSILMAYYYGFSREEISEHFKTPVNTVKSWLRRGIVRLQQCLEK
ncbi:sigma-70 family RNA polymerase sigma factor [Aliiglaciecola sp. M165]|uniref:sigma-70 family RNA polymerase sigma factor n=1 Tax=Aliiglaciecola sp. M165 TaxID=2593649 RepID=UPI00117F00F0|nr:sigma-70 family RNA polymerase sigma factor [Aliiglaciecola sp. M165]TRY31477.1 sigma-70 family RNA polymerase sigma factor [Aliiglaciecola sp. M165]